MLFLLFNAIFLWQDHEEEEPDAFDVSLTKNTQGLGITIAGYVGDKNSGELKRQIPQCFFFFFFFTNLVTLKIRVRSYLRFTQYSSKPLRFQKLHTAVLSN